MQLQLAIIDPKLVAGGKHTIITGIGASSVPIEDYQLQPLILQPGPYGLQVALQGVDADENLLRRDDYGFDDSESPFHYLLTKPYWKRVQCPYPAGEICMVNTPLPDAPVQEPHTFVFFGIVQGMVQTLSPYQERVLEVGLEAAGPSPSGLPMLAGMAHDTGIKAEHPMGNHLLQILTQNLWGFGDQPLGISTDISPQAYENIKQETRYFIDNGKTMPGRMASTSFNDEHYAGYLKAMDKAGLVERPQWETAELRKQISKVTERYFQETGLGM